MFVVELSSHVINACPAAEIVRGVWTSNSREHRQKILDNVREVPYMNFFCAIVLLAQRTLLCPISTKSTLPCRPMTTPMGTATYPLQHLEACHHHLRHQPVGEVTEVITAKTLAPYIFLPTLTTFYETPGRWWLEKR